MKVAYPMHLIAIAVMALLVRLAMTMIEVPTSGMTSHYLGLSDTMSAGYGYNRLRGGDTPAFHSSLRAESVRLSLQGQRLSTERRPSLDRSLLTPEFFRTPGYPLFLYGVYQLLGEPLPARAQVVQAILGALLPLLVFGLMAALFDQRPAAYASAWLTALYPPLAYASVDLLPEGLATLGVLASLLCIVCGRNAGRASLILAGGVLLGFTAYLRPNVSLLWTLLGAALFISMQGWLRPAIATALLIAGVYGALFPWALRNHELTSKWMWGTTGTGSTLWKAAGEYKNPWGLVRLDDAAYAYARAHGFDSDLTPEADAWFMAQMKELLREDPMFFVASTLKRIPWILAPTFDTGYQNPNRTRGMYSYFLIEEGLSPTEVLRRHPGYVVKAFWERILVMVTSALGSLALVWVAIAHGRRSPGATALFLAVPTYLIAVHAPTIYQPRYLVPMIPFQMSAIALLAASVLSWIRTRRDRRMLPA